jgi:hypothetical protein
MKRLQMLPVVFCMYSLSFLLALGHWKIHCNMDPQENESMKIWNRGGSLPKLSDRHVSSSVITLLVNTMSPSAASSIHNYYLSVCLFFASVGGTHGLCSFGRRRGYMMKKKMVVAEMRSLPPPLPPTSSPLSWTSS